jgi:electron transfer flavoprotein alpha/beta subunit
MRVLVCVKRVPAPGAKILIGADGQSLDTAHLGFTVSPHEECAVEEAVQIVEKHGGSATVLTLGPAEAEEQLALRRVDRDRCRRAGETDGRPRVGSRSIGCPCRPS